MNLIKYRESWESWPLSRCHAFCLTTGAHTAPQLQCDKDYYWPAVFLFVITCLRAHTVISLSHRTPCHLQEETFHDDVQSLGRSSTLSRSHIRCDVLFEGRFWTPSERSLCLCRPPRWRWGMLLGQQVWLPPSPRANLEIFVQLNAILGEWSGLHELNKEWNKKVLRFMRVLQFVPSYDEPFLRNVMRLHMGLI